MMELTLVHPYSCLFSCPSNSIMSHQLKFHITLIKKSQKKLKCFNKYDMILLGETKGDMKTTHNFIYMNFPNLYMYC